MVNIFTGSSIPILKDERSKIVIVTHEFPYKYKDKANNNNLKNPNFSINKVDIDEVSWSTE